MEIQIAITSKLNAGTSPVFTFELKVMSRLEKRVFVRCLGGAKYNPNHTWPFCALTRPIITINVHAFYITKNGTLLCDVTMTLIRQGKNGNIFFLLNSICVSSRK